MKKLYFFNFLQRVVLFVAILVVTATSVKAQVTNISGTINLANGVNYSTSTSLNLTGNVIFVLASGNNSTINIPIVSSAAFTVTVQMASGFGNLYLTGVNTYTGTTTISSGVTLHIGSITTPGAIAGNIVNNGTLYFNTNSSYSYTYSAILSGAGDVYIRNGVITLSGTNTSYTGRILITNDATLVFNNINNLGETTSTAHIFLYHNSTLRWGSGNTADVSSRISYNSTTVNVTYDVGNNIVPFASVLPNTTGTVTKAGTGVMRTTANQTYTGTTNVTAGSFEIGANNSLTGSITGNINLSNGTILYFTRGNAYTYDGVISGDGNVIQSAGGTTILTGINTYMGTTTIIGGTLQINRTENVGATTSPAEVLVNVNGTLRFMLTGTMTFWRKITGSGNIQVDNSSASNFSLILVGENTFSGTTTVAGNCDLFIGNGGNEGELMGNISLGNSSYLYFNRTGNFTCPGAISSTGTASRIYKRGAGTVTLTGANTSFQGSIYVEAGTLQVGNGVSNNASIPNNTALLQVNSGATLAFNPGNSTPSFSRVISGAGEVKKMGIYSLYFTGANTYTGNTTIEAGALYLGNLTNAGSIAGNVIIENNATIAFYPPNNEYTFSRNISGQGNVSVRSGSPTILTGTNTYTGTTTIESAVLQISTANNVGSTSEVLVNINGTLRFRLPNSSNLTFGRVIRGNGNIQVQNAGTAISTLFLTGNSSQFTGTTSVAVNCDLTIGNGGDAGVLGGNISLGNGSYLHFNRTGTLTYDGVISNTGSTGNQIYKNNSGTVILTGANTFTGDIRVQAGTLQLGNGATNNVIIPSNTALLQVNSGATLAFNPGSTGLTFSRAITGGGEVKKMGIYNLTFTGTNTYSGLTTIEAGTLSIGNNAAIGSISGNIKIGSGASLIISRSNQYEFPGDISGDGNVRKNGTGLTILTGTNSYSGTTTIAGGTLQIGAANNMGSTSEVIVNSNCTLRFMMQNDHITFGRVISGAGNIQVQNSSASNRILYLTANNTFTGKTTVAANCILAIGNGGGSGELRGDIELSDNNSHIDFDRTGSFTYQGVISNPNSTNNQVYKNGSGTLILTGVNTFSGPVRVYGGTLQLGNGTTNNVIIPNNTALLWINPGTTLAFNPGSSGLTFSRVITGDGEVRKLGGNSLSFITNQEYNGNTTIEAGMLTLGSNGTIGTIGGNITIQTGATLRFWRGPQILNTYTYGGNISGTGNVIQAGSGTTILTGTNSYSGTTTIQNGVLQIGAANNISNTSSITVQQNGILRFMLQNNDIIFERMIASISQGAGNIQVQNSGGTNRSLIITENNTFSGKTNVANLCHLSIGNGGATGQLTGDIELTGTQSYLTFNRTGSFTYTGVISSSPGTSNIIAKQGSGTVILTGANTFTGGINVLGGTLQVGNGAVGSIVSTGTAELYVGAGTTLAFNPGSSGLTLSRVISGAGGNLSKLGANTLTLSGVHTYSGNTNITAGTLTLGATGTIANSASVNLTSTTAKLNISAGSKTIKALNSNYSGAEVVLGARTLRIGNAGEADGTGSFAGFFSGTGEVTKTGTGTLTLSGNSTTTGQLTHSAGTLVLNGGSWAGDFYKSNATLTVTGAPVIGGTCLLNGGTINMNVTASSPSRIIANNVSATGNNILNITATTPVANYVVMQASGGITGTTPYTANVTPTYSNVSLSVTSPTHLLLTANSPFLGGTVTVTGSAVLGSTLTANTSGLTSNPSIPLGTLGYRWRRGVTVIPDATAATYTTVLADVGNNISVVVTASNCISSVTSAGVPITKQTQTAPAAPTMASATEFSITLNFVTANEFSINNGATWQTATLFSNLTPGTAYTFVARRVETATQSPSPASAPVTFSTNPLTSCGGNGTETNPYLICTAEDLARLATVINAGMEPYANAGIYYKLNNNIDLSAYGATWNSGRGWIPIGTFSPDRPFRGVFDGNGKVISGLYINNTAQDYAGLFGNVTEGTITNLGVENVNITAGQYVGGLVGNTNLSDISNCYTTGSVSGSARIGGFAGLTGGSLANSISNCYSTCNVTGGSTVLGFYIGGFVGENRLNLSYCYATGKVSGYNNLGGLIGIHFSGAISNCVAANTTITADGTTINRLAGQTTTSNMRNNYANEAMLVNGVTVSGGTLGNITGANVSMTTLTTLAFYSTSSNWSAAPWDIGTSTSSWAICETASLPHLRWQNINCSTFIPVNNITDLPTTATAGIPLTLTGTVFPSNATNQGIIWSVNNPGTTGATITGNTLHTTSGGTVTVMARIRNGTTSLSYTQTFDIYVETIPVTDITDVPTAGVAKSPLLLTGTVHPGNATFQTITWLVVNPGTTGATITGNTLHTTNGGALSVRATITQGISMTENYTKDFNITIQTIPVEEILLMSETAVAGTPLPLTGIVVPGNATNQTITYSIVNPGATGATISPPSGSGGWIFNSTAVGTATIAATIVDGIASGVNFVQIIPVTVHYQAVTGIVNVPNEATANIPLALIPDIVPKNASYQNIEWAVANAGNTGATITPTGEGGRWIFNATGGGIATIKASIQNGTGVGISYTQEFDINVNIVPVTNIINVPKVAVANHSLTLTGSVLPPNATYQNIQWSVVNAGATDATISSAGEGGEWIFKATTAGTATVRATIIDGLQLGTNYTKEFTIDVELKRWTFNPEDYAASMTVIGVVVNNDVEMRSDSIEIGAFSGNQCRGSVYLQYLQSSDRYIGFLAIYGDGNEDITLKVYDHATETEYEANNPPFAFIANKILGHISDPFVIGLGSTPGTDPNDPEPEDPGEDPDPPNITHRWVTDPGLYTSSMTMVAAVLNSGVEMRSDSVEIGAFHGEVCRGAAKLIYLRAIDRYLGFLMIFGDGTEQITLKVYDHATETEYSANNSPLSFLTNAMIGSLTNPYIIEIGSMIPAIITETLPNGTENFAYNQTLIATGLPPLTWTLTGGNLPTGLTLGLNGVISGIPTTAGTFSFSVRVANSLGQDDKQLSITIEEHVPVTNITPFVTQANVGVPLQLSANVFPSNATFQTIVWSVVDAGATGATITPAGGGGGWIFTATATGTATIRATIANGTAIGTPYTQDFSITVDPHNFCGGNGTETNPYLICTAEELALLATYTNAGNSIYNDKYYKLNNDIDLSDYGATWNDGKGWIPIGAYISNRPFRGVFDGNGKVITGLYIDNTAQYGVGVFGYVANTTITNLGVENVNISGRTNGVGGIIGYTNSNTNNSISNCYATGSVSGSSNVGGLVGRATGSISNCYFSGSVSGTVKIGGLVGYTDLSLSIVNSYSTGSVSGEEIGGLVGYFDGSGIVENCYSTTNVSGEYYTGGLIGVGSTIVITNCVAANSTITGTNPNRIIGWVEGATFINNYANEAMLVNGTTVSGGTLNNTNGLSITLKTLMTLNFYNTPANWHTAPWDIGSTTSIWAICEEESLPHLNWQDIECSMFIPVGNITNVPTTAIVGAPLTLTGTVFPGNATFQTITWSVVNAGTTGATISPVGGIFTATATGTATIRATIANGTAIGTAYTQNFTITVASNNFCGGDGTSGNPYLICTADELAQLATLVNAGNTNYRDKHYKLNNDIDLSAYGESWNDGKGWIPIGINWSTAFKGIFDGNGKVITGLYINNTVQSNAGLFGVVVEGTIKNLGVENVNIKGQMYVGGIVGYSEDFSNIITDCYATGSVSGSHAVGGLAGGGDACGSIFNCYFTGTVISSTGGYVGGLVGSVLNVNISNCYFSGSVIGGAGGKTGGLLGYAESSINIVNSYSTGSVSGGVEVGGLVGYLEPDSKIIEYCYSTATVSGTSSVGGLVGAGSCIIKNCVAANSTITGPSVGRIIGYSLSSVLTNNYANETMLVNGATVSGSLNDLNGLSMSLMTLMTLAFYNTPTNWNTAPWDIGTSTSVWAICEKESLPHLSWQDIECTLFCGGDGTETNPYLICTADDLALLATFVNEGNQDFNNKYYKLNNDIDLSAYGASWNAGKGWIPIGTYSPSMPFKGVFDGNSKVITGLYINNTTLEETGLFGLLQGTVKDLGVENVNITGGEYVGSLVGDATNSTISNCYTTGSVSGTMYIGGFLGYGQQSNISNCYSTCNVSGSGNYIGGFIGENRANISYCYATGNVSGNNNVGGLVGFFQGGTIRNCVAANSTITAIVGMGGGNRISGTTDGNTLTNNYANEAMLVNGAIITTGTHNNANGANASIASLTSLTFYNTSSNWNSAPWNIGTSTSIWAICENESLPHLTWQDIECTPVQVATQTIELKPGWNWVSTNVLNTSPSIMSQMQTSLGVIGREIKGSNTSTIFIAQNFWWGELVSISEKEMYQISAIANHSITLSGAQADPAATPITLNNGWNWIGYVPSSPMDVAVAMAVANPQHGDILKNQSQSSQYYGGEFDMWFPPANIMQPGSGYLYFSSSATPKTFCYPSGGKSLPTEYQPSFELRCAHNVGRFANNMVITAIVVRDNKEITGDHLEIQAFSGKECRGSVLMRYEEVLDRYLGYLMVHGESDETITLRVFDHLTGKEYATENPPFKFVINEMKGNIEKPYTVELEAEPSIGIDDETTGLQEISIYPNPTTGLLTISPAGGGSRGWKELTIESIEVFDIYGKKISSHHQIPSSSHHQIDVSHLASGIYFLKISNNSKTTIFKFVKE